MLTQSWRSKSAVLRMYSALTSNGYRKSIKAVRRQRNLGLRFCISRYRLNSTTRMWIEKNRRQLRSEMLLNTVSMCYSSSSALQGIPDNALRESGQHPEGFRTTPWGIPDSAQRDSEQRPEGPRRYRSRTYFLNCGVQHIHICLDVKKPFSFPL